MLNFKKRIIFSQKAKKGKSFDTKIVFYIVKILLVISKLR